MAEMSGLTDKRGRDWQAAWTRYTGIVEQRAFFYGGAAAREAAEMVLEAAKDNCPVETGHLRNSGRVTKLVAGASKSGTDEGIGLTTGSYAKNQGAKTAYIISFNTARVSRTGLSESDSNVKASLQRANRVQKVSARQKAYQSLRGQFNYAIIVHEGGGGRASASKFLERAYLAKKAELTQLFKHTMQNIFMRGSFR